MNGQRDVSRGGEKALGIIGIVFNILAIALIVFSILSFGDVQNNPEFRQYLEDQMLNDPALSTNPAEAQVLIDGLLASFGVVGWIIVGLLAISTVLALLAIAKLGRNRNPKLAGIFFIIAGLFAGLLSLTSILFYIAAIMCFVRKPRDNGRGVQDEETLRRENERLRDDNQNLHRDEQRLREKEDQLREKEEQLQRERQVRQTEHRLSEEDMVQREDLKRRADERLRKDSDDTPRRPL
ncbi:DUF4064 domain-containing protein [Planococcus sp. 1R117A]|uniref:DUF4064 domain-containing protein n=1 Tax=Planococcus sp. 1R117A TaxID=3447020 RepID=UPI003EDC019E